MKSKYRIPQAAVAVFAALAVLPLAQPQAWAGIVFGVDVKDYIVMYEGNNGKNLSINNFGSASGTWTGDIGVAGTGKLQASGPGIVDGKIDFAAANTGQASVNNTTVNDGLHYGVSSVQTTMNLLNTLSANLGAMAGSGTSLAINTSVNSGNQVVLASSGNLVGGNRLFNVTSVNTGNGENLIIKSDGTQGVVLDVNTPGDAQFHGNVLLQDLNGRFFGDAGYSGLSPDQLLINLWGGSNLKGGDKLDANNNGNNAHPQNIIYGVFLDPNGPISFVNTRIVGRIFGGDSSDMQIVSGDTITLPQCCSNAPEPGTFPLALGGLAFLGVSLVRRRLRGSAVRS